MSCDQSFSDAPGIESCHLHPALSDQTALTTAVKVTVKPCCCIMETGPLHSSPCLPISPLHLSPLPHLSVPLLSLSPLCLFHLSDLVLYLCLLHPPGLPDPSFLYPHLSLTLSPPTIYLSLTPCCYSPLSPSSSSPFPSFLCSLQPVEPIRPCKRGPFATVVWSV